MSRMARLGSSRRAALHTAAHAASASSPCLRGSGGCAGGGRRGSRGIPSGSGSIAGCTTASRMALRGGCAWIHTSTPTSSQGRRRGRPRSQDDVMVAPYEFYPWPRPAHGMSRVLIRLCNARGQLPQGASGEIGWRQAGWSNFRNGAKSALLSPRCTVKASHTRPFENHTKSDPATRPWWSSREHGHQRG